MATYACSDLHGQWSLWEQIKEYCQPEDTIYFLGDAIDRGADGLEILIDMCLDGRVVYLKGNHEDMMYKACLCTLGYDFNEDFRWQDSLKGIRNRAMKIWDMNGNFYTAKKFFGQPYCRQMWILKSIERMPVKLKIINKNNQKIFFSHAGASQINYTFDEFCSFQDNPFIWDRGHFCQKIKEEDKEWIFIHGHSPVKHLSYLTQGQLSPKNILEPFIYAEGHKVDIDLGSAETEVAALFDIDELRTVKIFKKQEKEND